jgi:hypothetical protein
MHINTEHKQKDNRGLKEGVRRLVLSFELHDLLVKLALLCFGLYVLVTQLAIVLNWDKNFKEFNLRRK